MWIIEGNRVFILRVSGKGRSVCSEQVLVLGSFLCCLSSVGCVSNTLKHCVRIICIIFESIFPITS